MILNSLSKNLFPDLSSSGVFKTHELPAFLTLQIQLHRFCTIPSPTTGVHLSPVSVYQGSPSLHFQPTVNHILSRSEHLAQISSPNQEKDPSVLRLHLLSIPSPQPLPAGMNHENIHSSSSGLIEEVLTNRLERSLILDASVDAWAKVLALRDFDTLQHTLRATELTLLLSQKLGFQEDQLPVIQRGAKLHDIGKMGIPDEILHKPGPLTADDWRIMQKHPVYAYEMLAHIPYMDNLLDIPYCHHEKWDGSGYPRGLKGVQIPLPARIFAVVDVWDALRSDRPYRAAWPQKEAIQYILDQSGSHFDPVIVAAFVEILGAV
jgi:HD-GYP domain-containing protein (c-di-GMP phosphodiesterase class II)